MRQLFTFLFIAISTVSCGQVFSKKDNGNIQTENRKVEAYTQVANIGSLDVILTEGTMGEIRVEASDNILEYILTTVQNGELTIKLDPKYNYALKHKAMVYVPINSDLRKILQSGSGDIEMKHQLEVDKLECELVGSGDVKINVKANQLSLKIVGSGDIETKGSAIQLQTEVIGAGDVMAKKLIATNAKAIVNGSGDTVIFVTEKVEASILGAGDIIISGNPKTRDTKVLGVGDIRYK
ncbi:head GIN domain-containing protein [Capnocytophaga catalasegens]|nr:head GIN domain-containing protein [Capnocytophaga catalasegens]